MIFKVKLFVNEENGEMSFIDAWIDLEKATGFFIPLSPETSEQDNRLISIYIEGGTETIKKEDKIVEFLTDKFIKKAV